MERALQANPHDRTVQTHIQVLNQVRSIYFGSNFHQLASQLQRLVERGVSQAELRQILDQLRTLARSALPPPIVRLPQRQAAPQYYASQSSFPPQTVPPRPYSEQPTISVTAAPTAIPTVPANLQNLFASLVNAGFISSSAAPSGSTAAPAIASKDSTPTVEDDQDLKESAIREYRNSILSDPIKLTTSDLAK
jgi:pre-mRNA cleavage complex 2 protein Pcf11